MLLAISPNLYRIDLISIIIAVIARLQADIDLKLNFPKRAQLIVLVTSVHTVCHTMILKTAIERYAAKPSIHSNETFYDFENSIFCSYAAVSPRNFARSMFPRKHAASICCSTRCTGSVGTKMHF